MYFKLEYTIREVSLPKGEVLVLDLRDTHTIQVEIRAPNDEEQKIGHKTQHAFCTAQTEIEPSKKNTEVFTQIEGNKILEPESQWRLKYKDQDGNEICLPSIDEFPEHFRAFIGQVNKELSEASRLVINVMRWRVNRLGPHQAISTRGMSWSRDKQFWYPAPSSLTVRISDISSTVHLSDVAKNDIRKLISNKTQEPVYHELFRESWGQKDVNPRSSLVIGMSSLEVAIKATIGNLVPNASWLAENISSPPVCKLLNEYLPQLPTVNSINSKVLPPPKRLMDLLKEGVFIRNQIAHIGGKAPNYDTLVQILDAIQDIIWLLDYYCGHNWAYDFISEETKFELEKA